MQIKYDNQFLDFIKRKVLLMQLAQMRPFAKNTGKTVDMVRYTRRAPVTAHLTEGSSGSASSMAAVHIRATLKELGVFFQPSTLYSFTSRDPGLEEYVKVLAQQATESIDIKAMSQVCLSGGWPIRADLDTNFYVAGSQVTGGAGTDTFAATGITIAEDDDANGGHVVFTDPDGPNYLAGGCVADSTASGSVFYLGAHSTAHVEMHTGDGEYPDALAEDTTTDDAVTYCGVHDIGATDVISATNINMALRVLQQNHAAPAQGNYFVGIVDPYVAYDLRKDSTWVNLSTYKDSVDNIYTGEIGELYGIRWLMTTQPWRHAVDAYTYSETGAVHVVPIFGAKAFGMMELSGQGKHIIAVKGPSKYDPLDMYQTIGWKVINAVKTLNAFNSCLLLVGATA